jgi:DHA2 family multidrug resistance protein-like MFS transporter
MNVSDSRVHERRWLILAVLCLSLFLVVVDNLIVNVAIPTLSRELNAGTSALQWIVDSYSLVFAGLLLAAGGVGDRFGRKGTLQIGLVLFAICSTFAAFSGSTGSLIFWRGAMGIGAALVFPATLAIVTNVFTDPVERAKAIGVWSAVSGAAVAFGPVAGGLLLEHFWWGSVFLINVPIVAVALLLGARFVPTSKDPSGHHIEPLGFILSIAMIGLLVFTVIEGPHRGWASAATLGGFAASAALLAAFIAWELRVANPLLDVRTFRNARFSAGSTAIFIAFFALFGFTFLVTQYFQYVRGYSTLSSGLHTLPFAIGAGITGPSAARLALRFGTKRVVSWGLFSMALGLALASQFEADTSYWAFVVPSMVLLASGLGCVTSPATEAVMGSVTREKAGIASAVNDTAREVGGTLGVAVVGSVFASLYGPKILDNLAGLPIPKEGLDAAESSMAAALIVAERAPAAGQGAIVTAARDAFMSGWMSASLVAAGIAIVGSVLTLVFLPNRAASHDISSAAA